MQKIEYLVILGYFVLIIVVGWAFKRFSSNTDDYFKGGCKGTWWLVGVSAFMSTFSAWTFTGAAGMAYESGFSVMIIFFGNALGYFLNFCFMAPWLRQLRATTFPEAISLRYGERTRSFYALYEVPIRILYAAMQLYTLGIFCSAVFGYDIRAVIIVSGIVVLFYSATGGRWAVMATDFLQGLILVPLTVIVAWLCLDKLGGVGNLFQQIEDQGLKEKYSMINPVALFAGAYTWGWASAMTLKQFIVYNSLNAAPRYFSVKDGNEARKAAILACVLMLVGSIFWFLPPMAARLLFSEEVMAMNVPKPAETSYAIISMKLLPAGLIGMIVVAILTATMSSMDTGLNTNVAIMLRDIYPKLAKRFSWKVRSEKELLFFGRVYTWALGALIISLALYFAMQEGKGIFEIMLDVGALLATPIAVPLLWGLFVKRTPWWAAFMTIGFAFVGSCLAFFDTSFSIGGFYHEFSEQRTVVIDNWFTGLIGLDPINYEGAKWTFQHKMFTVFGLGTVGFLLSTFFAPAADSEHRSRVNEFFKRMKTPIDFKNEIGEGNDLRQLGLVGRFGAAVSVFVALLILIPNPTNGRLAILALSLVIGGVSALMIKAGKKRDS